MRHLNLVRLLAFLLALSFARLAGAEEGVGYDSIYWSGKTETYGGTNCVRSSTASDATCTLFPAGAARWQRFNSMTVTSSGAGGACCFSLDPGVTVTLDPLAISDPGGPNGSGAGSCMPLPLPGATWNARPVWVDLQSLAGAEVGICVGTVSKTAGGAGDATLHPPCASTTDCQVQGLSGSDAVCTTSSWSDHQLQFVGAYLLCGSTYTNKFWYVKGSVIR